jgi:hypothetical protein
LNVVCWSVLIGPSCVGHSQSIGARKVLRALEMQGKMHRASGARKNALYERCSNGCAVLQGNSWALPVPEKP